jgi:hypothetical protein
MNISEKILWDAPLHRRKELAVELNNNPCRVLKENETLFVKALNSLSWYELISIFGCKELTEMLTDDTINKVYPPQRRNYYKNARRLLSKYSLSAAG